MVKSYKVKKASFAKEAFFVGYFFDSKNKKSSKAKAPGPGFAVDRSESSTAKGITQNKNRPLPRFYRGQGRKFNG